MSYWTSIHASFSVSTSCPMNTYIGEAMAKALQKLGLAEGNEVEIAKGCGNEPNAGDVINALSFNQDIFNRKTFRFYFPLLSFRDAKTGYFVKKLELPLIPLAPYGSEGGLSVTHAFDAEHNCVNVSMIGGLRDFEPEDENYIKFWLNTVAAMLNTEILYTYDNAVASKVGVVEHSFYGEDCGELCSEDEAKSNETVDILARYIRYWMEWVASEDEGCGHGSWRWFVNRKMREEENQTEK